MKKPYKKKAVSNPQKLRNWLMPLVVIGLVIVGVMIFFNIQRPTLEPEVHGAPRAEISQTVIDHGNVAFEQPVESVFVIRNIGDQRLSILGEPRVELIDGC